MSAGVSPPHHRSPTTHTSSTNQTLTSNRRDGRRTHLGKRDEEGRQGPFERHGRHDGDHQGRSKKRQSEKSASHAKVAGHPVAAALFSSSQPRFSSVIRFSLNSPLVQRWRRRLCDRRLHEFLWYCVPGVVVAVVIRALLTAGLPYAQFHFDTPDFLQTPYDLLHAGRLTLHNKKTFPHAAALHAALPVAPARPDRPSPWDSNALGTLLVLMIGALARLWFRFWRWLIVPLTILTAIQPSAALVRAHPPGRVAVRVSASFGPCWRAHSFARRAEPRVVHVLARRAVLHRRVAARGTPCSWRFGVLLILWDVPPAMAAAAWQIRVSRGLMRGDASRHAHAAGRHPCSTAACCISRRINPGLRRGSWTACVRYATTCKRSRARRVSNDVVRVEKTAQRADRRLLRLQTSGNSVSARPTPTTPAASTTCACGWRWRSPERTRSAYRASCSPRFRARLDDDSGGEFTDHELQTRQYRALKRDSRRDAVLGIGLAGVPLGTEGQHHTFHLRPLRRKSASPGTTGWNMPG